MATDESMNNEYINTNLLHTIYTGKTLFWCLCVVASYREIEPIARYYNFDFILECHLVGFS